MKHRISELEGALLDAAVAKAEGWSANPGGGYHAPILIDVDEDKPLPGSAWEPQVWRWSTDWAYGGPIIERERMLVAFDDDEDCWSASVRGMIFAADETPIGASGEYWEYGPTPLVAAMRAFVASRFGEEVELP